MPKITPEQMVQQWATLPNKFGVNVWNFETVIGDEAQRIFKKSFFLQKFNDGGATAWRPRSQNKGTKRSYHRILNETGSLRASIKWRHTASIPGRKGGGVVIYTDPGAFGGTKRNVGVCYAAIHNAPSNSYEYGKTGVKSVQRQFIGHSSYLRDAMKKYSIKIFDGFPKT